MKKEKGVVIVDHERCSEAEEDHEQEREETPTDFSTAAVTFCSRYASSQYDFVKVHSITYPLMQFILSLIDQLIVFFSCFPLIDFFFSGKGLVG